MRALLLVLLVQLTACGFNPHPKNGALSCNNGSCPSGYTCNLSVHRCWRNGELDGGGSDGPGASLDVSTGHDSSIDVPTGPDASVDVPLGPTGGATGGTMAGAGGTTAGLGGTVATSGDTGTVMAGAVAGSGGTPAVLGGTVASSTTSTATGGAASVPGGTTAIGTSSSGARVSAGATAGAGGTTASAGGSSVVAGGSTTQTGGNAGASSIAGGSTAGGGQSTVGGTTSVGGTTATAGTTTSSSSAGGSTGGSTAQPLPDAPCDILETASTPCVGAYSMVRALYKAYDKPLYQVRSVADTSSLKDITLLTTGGYANSKVQDDFCSGGCTIARLYDQSPRGNDLTLTPAVCYLGSGTTKATCFPGAPMAKESKAELAPHTVAGHPVYGLKFTQGLGNSYRCMTGNGTATGDQPEFMYEVVDSTVYNAGCCNEFGNAETTGTADSGGEEAISYGSNTNWGHGSGSGPWLMAALGSGLFPNDPNMPSLSYSKYATLMLKSRAGNRLALKSGDGQKGYLQTLRDGVRTSGPAVMQKQGSIVLGTGGDGNCGSTGVFFEGAITAGCADDDTVDNAIQANIVAAGYGK